MTQAASATQQPQPPSMRRVVGDQKRVVLAALVLAVAGFWPFAVFGMWAAGVLLAVGVLLGLVNQLATEYSLLKMISSGRELTRGKITSSAILRLSIVTVVAVAIVVIFWSTGVVALIGLAIFRLIALVMTTVPLLKELSNS